jgi:hypothetical protein
MKKLEDLLENEVLGEDVKTALKEAFENKVKLAEAKLQEDYAARYQHDKAKIVEAMDSMLNDAIRNELTEFAEDRSALIQSRTKFSKATVNAKRIYESKVNQHTKLLNQFIAKNLKEELKEFVADKKKLNEQRKQMARQVQTIKESTKAQLADRVNKLETFVLKNLSEEIAEFTADKKALVEQRVKLANEGRKKIHETQSKFINKATNLVNRTLNEVIKTELVQWRDDIKAARENNFGRRIFEAVAAEYMGSYLSEGSQIKKLQAALTESKQQANVIKAKLNTQQKLVEQAEMKARAANDRTQRLQTMSELLSPLGKDKKAIMEELLRDIKTANLKEAFNRYLPTVVNGNGRTHSSNVGKVNLTETYAPRREAITGNRRVTNPEVVIEESGNHELGQLLFLAGLNNNKEVKEN